MGRPGLASRPRSANNSPRRTAAPVSPVASPTRRKIVNAPLVDAPLQPSTPQENSDDPDSGSGGGNKPPSQTYGDPAVGGLSQLSDLADGHIGSEPGSRAVSQYKPPPSVQMAISSQSQERLEVDIGNDLPSQPDIPTPRIPDGPPAPSLPQHADVALDRVLPQHDDKGLRVKALVDSIKNPASLAQPMVPQHAHAYGALRGSGSAEEEALHPKSRAARRGPMDEMRQLVRILVKIIPQSMGLVTSGPEGGGNNRISEEQIKSYLTNTVGEAPYPQWGVPQGWGQYLAELLTWASGRPISKNEAMRCARREPGRSWQAIPAELARLGVFPEKWALPLSAAGQRLLLDQNPGNAAAAVGHAQLGAVKRQFPEPGPTLQQAQPKRRAVQSAPEAKVATVADRALTQLEACSEVELWRAATEVIRMAQRRAGSTATRDQHALSAAQQELRRALEVSVPSSQLPIANLEAGPPASVPGLAATVRGLTPEQVAQWSLQTGQQITTRTEGGMQYAELPLGPGADPGQAVSQMYAFYAHMQERTQNQPASLASVPMQQPTSLNGSLGTIPHTDSQSHISPPPHQPETQASQGPLTGAPNGQAAADPSQGGGGNMRRLSFDNHPGLQVGGELVAAEQPAPAAALAAAAAAAAAAPQQASQGFSSGSDLLLHHKNPVQRPIDRPADAPASSGGFLPLSQESRGGSVAQRPPITAAGRSSPLGAPA